MLFYRLGSHKHIWIRKSFLAFMGFSPPDVSVSSFYSCSFYFFMFMQSTMVTLRLPSRALELHFDWPPWLKPRPLHPLTAVTIDLVLLVSRFPAVSRTVSAAFCCCCHKLRFWFKYQHLQICRTTQEEQSAKNSASALFMYTGTQVINIASQFSSCLTGETHKVTQTGNFNMYSGGTYLRVSQLLNLGEQPSQSDDSTETFACCRGEASHRVPEEHRQRLHRADGLLWWTCIQVNILRPC